MKECFFTANLCYGLILIMLLSLPPTTVSFGHSKTVAPLWQIRISATRTTTQLGFAPQSIRINCSYKQGVPVGSNRISGSGYNSNEKNHNGYGERGRSLHTLVSPKDRRTNGDISEKSVKFGRWVPRNVLFGSASLFRVPTKVSKNHSADDPLHSIRVFRQLPLRTACLVFVIYHCIGVFAYKVVFPEVTWSVLDALYFSCVCLSTVGYGDLVPTTEGGKLFAAIFGMSGILLWSSAIASVGTTLVQSETTWAKAKLRKHRRNALVAFYDRHMHDLSKVKQCMGDESNGDQGDDTCPLPTDQSWPLSTSSSSPKLEPEERKKGRQWIHLVQSLIRPLTIILAGGTLIGKLEGWNLFDSFYFSLITASTIGLGDYSPCTRAGRMASIFLIPAFLAAAGDFFARVGIFVIRMRTEHLFGSQAERAEWLTEKQAHEMDLDENGMVSKSEYVLYMLMEAGIVSKDEFKVLEEQFKRFDVTRSGYIESEDLKAMKKFREKLRRDRTKEEKRLRESQE